MYDLHIHSSFSDGSDDIDTLIDNIKQAGVNYFSITDHDTAISARTILNDKKFIKKIKSNSLTYVIGTEWSCDFKGYGVHILAYDFDPFSKEVIELEQEIKNLLKEKSEIRLNAIKDMGYKFSEWSTNFLNSRINIKRVDIANALVRDGYFENLQDAMENCINLIKFPKKYRLDAEKVISTLSNIGAKMVWAHSIHGFGKKPISFEEIENIATEMKKFGLAGLECYYSLFDKNEIENLVKIANNLDLFITCGSDYHGKNRQADLGVLSSDGTLVDEKKIIVRKIFRNTIG